MPTMTLKVLLPFDVFAEETDVASLVVETAQGAFGVLPQRLDCVAAVVPGILSVRSVGQGETFIAVDEGVLVKTGSTVAISVRRALRGRSLDLLREAVEKEFLALDAQERALHTEMARLETGLLRRFATLHGGSS